MSDVRINKVNLLSNTPKIRIRPASEILAEAMAVRTDISASIEPFEPRTEAKSWGHEVLVAHTPQYTGKVLYRYAAEPWHRGGLQWHRTKDETFYLHEGEVIVYWVDADGLLRKRAMHPGQSFHVPPGAIHSVQTVTDSTMFEASTAVFDDRVNVEADYDIMKAVES